MLQLVALGLAAVGVVLALLLVRTLRWISPVGAIAFTGIGPAGFGLTAAFC